MLDNQGSKKIVYSGQESSIVCAGDRKSMVNFAGSDAGELKNYTDEYFEGKALLMARISVRSGSDRPSFKSVMFKEGRALVTLKYYAPKIGTCDMATYLIWAEMDRKYAGYDWEISNPALKAFYSRF